MMDARSGIAASHADSMTSEHARRIADITVYGACSSMAERQIVALEAAGSIPVRHPTHPHDALVADKFSPQGICVFAHTFERRSRIWSSEDMRVR